MLLIWLFFVRLGPLFCLKFGKNRKTVKWMLRFLVLCLVGLLVSAIGEVLERESWKGIWYFIISMFPHYIFYGMALWMICRCVWKSWSERVWKRIYRLSIITILLGILSEYYLNLQILEKILKNI